MIRSGGRYNAIFRKGYPQLLDLWRCRIARKMQNRWARSSRARTVLLGKDSLAKREHSAKSESRL